MTSAAYDLIWLVFRAFSFYYGTVIERMEQRAWQLYYRTEYMNTNSNIGLSNCSYFHFPIFWSFSDFWWLNSTRRVTFCALWTQQVQNYKVTAVCQAWALSSASIVVWITDEQTFLLYAFHIAGSVKKTTNEPITSNLKSIGERCRSIKPSSVHRELARPLSQCSDRATHKTTTEKKTAAFVTIALTHGQSLESHRNAHHITINCGERTVVSSHHQNIIIDGSLLWRPTRNRVQMRSSHRHWYTTLRKRLRPTTHVASLRVGCAHSSLRRKKSSFFCHRNYRPTAKWMGVAGRVLCVNDSEWK